MYFVLLNTAIPLVCYIIVIVIIIVCIIIIITATDYYYFYSHRLSSLEEYDYDCYFK